MHLSSALFVGRIVLPALLLSITFMGLSIDPQLPADRAPKAGSKVRALYDGESHVGLEEDDWEEPASPSAWQVERTQLLAELPESANTPTELVWKEPVADFELRLEARVESGLLSVVHRGRRLDSPHARDSLQTGPANASRPRLQGYAHQLSVDPVHFGTLREDQGPRGELAKPGYVVATFTSGETRRLRRTPWQPQHARAGEWQRHVIRAVGDRITHEVDGLCVTELTDQDGRYVRDSGFLALRLAPGTRAALRDFRLRHLGPIPAAVAPLSRGNIEWIWSQEQPGEGEQIILVREFSLSGVELQQVASAQLWMTCDNRFDARLNGHAIAASQEWQRPVRVDVSRELLRPDNRLVVIAENDGGPAGLAGRIRLLFDNGQTREWVTNDQWSWTGVSSEEVHPVHSFGITAAPRGPWSDPFVERHATPATHITVPAEFTVERLRSAQPGEGSWVAMTFDGRGRIIISPQSGTLLRWQRGAGTEGVLTRMPTELGSAQGLLVVNDDLYVTVNRGSESGLYRARDTDGDGDYDETQLLKSFAGVGEHGPHGLRLGPDGWIYMVHGNMTSLPEGLDPHSPVRHYAEDIIAPREWDPRGHAHNVLAPGGRVLRTDLDGSRWQIYAAGMRNAYDLAFSASGELFTFDSDMEWDIGLPWYRPTRVLHLVSGGEYGWRSGSGKWPAYYPDQLPSVVDVGEGSPTGLEFATHSHFPERYRHSLFIADWTFGRILTVELDPRGASYGGELQAFLQGKGLCVTDMEFGPDGALYFVTGGRGTQSGLYRVSAQAPIVPAMQTPSGARFEVQLRRQLEAAHTASADESQWRLIWTHLGSNDPFLDNCARVALERQPWDAWQQRVLGATRSAATLTALLSLARVGDDSARCRVLARIAGMAALAPPTTDDLRRLWFRELRSVGVALARLQSPLPVELRLQLIGRYDPLLTAQHSDAQLELARVLVQLKGESLGPRFWQLHQSATRIGPQIEWGMLLCDRIHELTSHQQVEFFQGLRRCRNRQGGMSFAGYLDHIAQHALAQLPDQEREAQELLLARDQPPPPVIPEYSQQQSRWKLADLLPELHRVDTGRSFEQGKRAFESSFCLSCHRFGSDGGTVGPDLSAVGRRFARQDLLEATLLPSRAISDQYEHTMFTLNDGSQLTGRVVSADAVELRIATDPLGLSIEQLPRAQIRSQRPSPVSPMPANLMDSLSVEEILDLLAYMESGGDPKHGCFEE